MDAKKIIGCLGGLAALLVLVAIVGAVGWFAMHEDEYADELTMPGTEGYAVGGLGSWNGQTTMHCGGNDQGTVTGVTAALATTAIVAGGNCQLVVEGAQITAPVVVEASGNARVVFRGGVATGTVQFANVSGNAHVVVEGAQVTGPVQTSSNGRVEGL